MQFQAESGSRLQADWLFRDVCMAQSAWADVSCQPGIPFHGWLSVRVVHWHDRITHRRMASNSDIGHPNTDDPWPVESKLIDCSSAY